jgi:hypothetical protein
MALAVLVYCTAAVSGGKLNPAVSAAAALVDRSARASEIVLKLLYEWTAQIFGAMAGVAMAKMAAPPLSGGVGCFIPSGGVTDGQVRQEGLMLPLALPPFETKTTSLP